MISVYYPELGDKTPSADIQAQYGWGNYIVKTRLALSGRGITFGETSADGVNRYTVTVKAFERLGKKYNVASKVYLD